MIRKQYSLKWAFILAQGIICLSVLAIPALADYPVAENKYVNDYASVITSGDVEAITKMLENLEYQTGIQMTLLTVRAINSYSTEDTDIVPFATHLFNKWGIGNKNKNDGILIIVAVDDRACRIELGKGYPSYYNSLMQGVINENMLPYFKNGEYSRGAFESVRAVIGKVAKKVSWLQFYKWHLLLITLILVCIFAGISCMHSGKQGWGWALFAAAGVLILFLVKFLMSGKKSDGFGGGKSGGGGATGRW